MGASAPRHKLPRLSSDVTPLLARTVAHPEAYSQGVHAPNRRLIEFVYGKSWLCWDVGHALFSKVTLFSLCLLYTSDAADE